MEFNREFSKIYTQETTRVGEILYDVDKLKNEAENIPIQEISLNTLLGAVSEGNYYWIDQNNEKLGPFQILKDWDAAQRKEEWSDHIANIRQANLDNPIWITKQGLVFDGMHRLTKAVLEGKENIKVKVWDNLPDIAIIKE